MRKRGVSSCVREGSDIPVSSLVRTRVVLQQSDGENREWAEIADSLESPPSFDETVIKFSVRHFSGYVKVAVLCVFIVCILHLLDGTTLFMHVIWSRNGQVSRMLLRGIHYRQSLDTIETTRDPILQVFEFPGSRI